MEEQKKMSAREWLENIWYHYKWLIICGGLLVIFVIISLFQLFRSANSDVSIMHVGSNYISPAANESLQATVASLSRDYNDDGDIKVSVLDITVNKFTDESAGVELNYDHENQGRQRFQTEIRAGDAYIYLLEESFFETCVALELLTPLSELFGDSIPGETVGEYGIRLSSLDAHLLPGLENVPSDAVLCLRRSPEKDEIRYSRTVEDWEGNRETFVNIVSYKK